MSKKIRNFVHINKYRRKREMNIGIFIFAVVLIYLFVAIVLYATDKKINVYEVREGSIIKDSSYSGLILRKEEIVTAEETGFINYYHNENSKLRTHSNVYVITQKKLSIDPEVSTESTLNTDGQNTLIVMTQSFNQNFDTQKFSSVYSLKNEIKNTIQNATNQTKTYQLDTLLAETQENASVFQTTKDGIMVLTFDGYESLTTNSLSDSDFDRSQYNLTSLSDNMKVENGDPAYKLVSSEEWSIMIKLNKNTAEELSDVKQIKTRIDKDNETLWADFSIINKNGEYYGQLNYNDSMIRYVEERFLNVELITEDKSGLKIPKSSVIEEQFYVIPKEYLTTGGNSSASGVMVQKENGDFTFQTISISASDAEGNVLVQTSFFKKGTVLAKPESADTIVLSQTKSHKGVYNINKGYAVFKQVTILTESDEYYIVSNGDSYGLYNYDHIVQDGNTVKAGEVVF